MHFSDEARDTYLSHVKEQVRDPATLNVHVLGRDRGEDDAGGNVVTSESARGGAQMQAAC